MQVWEVISSKNILYVTLPSDIGMQLELDTGVKCTNTS